MEKIIQEAPPSDYKKFIVDYPFEGGYWSFHIYATSFDEAERRVHNLQYGKLVGELGMTIPAWAAGRFWAPVVCFFANLFSRDKSR